MPTTLIADVLVTTTGLLSFHLTTSLL